MINLGASFPDNSGAPNSNYPYGSARNVTTTGDNTGTPFVASLQNDIIGTQQYLLQEAGIVPSNTSDTAVSSQQFDSMWKIFNIRTLVKNLTVNGDYTLTTKENLKTRLKITDTGGVLTATRNIILDNTQKQIIAYNNTLQTLIFKTLAGTGVTIPSNSAKILYCDGVNVIDLYSEIDFDLNINELAAKTTPVDTDELVLADSAETFGLKKLTFTNLKATLKTYFDTLYNNFVANDSRVKTALNASGSAPVYASRVWVNFNGTGVVAINASGNISSIADNGTGDYTCNLLTALPDINYEASYGARRSLDSNVIVSEDLSRTVSSIRILVRNKGISSSGGGVFDSDMVYLSIRR